jgi:DNA-binding transcriptional LysR family regulator
MSFDHRQLRAFLAVVDTGSLGRATAEVNLSQPALSRLIQDMEARLGATLFDRRTTGMTLTSFGDALVPHARMLLYEMAQAVEALDALRGLRRGTARVGAVATIARSILPKAIDRLLAAAPGLRVELLEAADDRLVTALHRREVDLMIAGSVPGQDEIIPIAECRFDDRYVAFCAAGHPLAALPSVSLDDVLTEHWVMPARGATPRDLFEEAVRKAGRVPPNVAVETWSSSAIVSCVVQTRFLGWLPRPLVTSEVASSAVRIFEIPALAVFRRFFAYRRSRGLLPTAAARLLEELPLLAPPDGASAVAGWPGSAA